VKKKILIGLGVIFLAALMVAAGTWAWFTAEAEPVINQFTTGTVEIEIIDEYEEITNWNPGDTADKDVSIENLGTKCAYVRVKLTPAWGDMVEESSCLMRIWEQPMSLLTGTRKSGCSMLTATITT